ncbi:MAG: hypothetical protein Q8R47_05365 [Nanoarchaeota archaeon]|nr:hypothetical protein [Nanoarchaeota archaeon]
MSFFHDKKKIKVSIEDYVASWRAAYGTGSLFPFQEICSNAGIELLQSRNGTAWAFKFENGPRGVAYDPHLPGYPLIYNLTKKISHHLLGHFEREPPIYLAEAEAHYFAAAAINVPLITLRCIHAPPWYGLFVSKEKIKRDLANHYSLKEKPVLL